jgi:hypothetical protein
VTFGEFSLRLKRYSCHFEFSKGAFMSLLVKRTQHAIGQGGFHSSYLYVDDECFSFVFDCGGSTDEHRDGIIGPVVAKGKHDWLVVSHLDEDHINGVAQLEKEGVKFSNVFLPHVDLSPYMFLMLMKNANATSVAGVAATLGAILTVGRLYAGAYGRVRVVVPGDPDRGGQGRPDVFPNPNYPAPMRLPNLTPPTNTDPSVVLDAKGQSSLGATGSIIFQDTQSIFLQNNDWEFRFYSEEWTFPSPIAALWALPVLKPLRDAMEHLALLGTDNGKAFTDGIDAALDAKVSVADANTALHNINPAFAKVRKELSVNSLLKKLYKALPDLHDYNSASLCLYSGPADENFSRRRQQMRYITIYGTRRQHRGSRREVGWLGMGDAHLHDAATFGRFRKHYGNCLQRLSTLVLPHHGSRHNYDAEQIQLHRLLAQIGEYPSPLFVAASNPAHKRFKHPHQEVVAVASMYGQVHNVNLDPDSALSEIIVEVE